MLTANVKYYKTIYYDMKFYLLRSVGNKKQVNVGWTCISIYFNTNK